MEQKKTIKAAIYTRKSSEEGLELDFNSLDAQREACESYIKSQKHEGWVLVDKEYSDGGISGGTLERPALKELLQDIKDGLVDMIVVYKIDRLTRSLHDFSKLVDIFDKYNSSFVSITQQFNTSTSMGRLTLNMLLSFAQFEREVTGERIRDKKLATARKGMWISGQCPYGYKLGYSNSNDIHIESEFRHRASKKLIPNDDEMVNLIQIFELYKEIKSTGKLKEKLKELHIFTRSGKEWKVGALNNLLRRKTYIGKITHKNIDYDGIHQPILDKSLFDQIQQILNTNRLHNGIKTYAKESSLLSGKIFDDKGWAMSPSHSTKSNKRYRYYLSQAYIQRQKTDAGSLPQIPAQQLEEYSLLFIKQKLSESLKLENYEIALYQKFKENLDKFCEKEWSTFEERVLIKFTLEKIIVSSDLLKIHLKTNVLQELAEWIGNNKKLEEFQEKAPKVIQEFTEFIQLKRVNKGNSLIIGDTKLNKNESMINIIKQSFDLHNKLLSGTSIEELQNTLQITKRRLERILQIRFLAPYILTSILEGTQPQHWNTHLLYNCYSLDWKEQKEYFGI